MILGLIDRSYLRLTMWSSWFPLFRWTWLGYTSRKPNRMSRISKEFLPRSTKSPLKTYGFSEDGKPFWGLGWVG